MSTSGVARAYAQALFDAAQAVKQVEQVRGELSSFAEALRQSDPLRTALLDPQVDTATKGRVLAGVTSGGNQLVVNVLRLMLHKGRVAAIPDAHAEFERLAAEAEQRVDVQVTSAVPLDADAERAVVTRVESATGRTVRLTKRVDPDVIGGLVIQVGDVVLDASLRARADQLREQMQQAR